MWRVRSLQIIRMREDRGELLRQNLSCFLLPPLPHQHATVQEAS